MHHRNALITVGTSIALLGFGGPAAAIVLIDADVEDDGDWSTFSQLVFSANATFLSPAFIEGTVAADMNHTPVPGDSIIRTFTGTQLQLGTYTVEFAIGNQSNAPFPPSINIEFTGMGLDEATSATTPTPASGTWELWTIEWEVDSCNPNLGDELSWELAVTTGVTSNLRFDGVGSLSSSGDGFVVSYEQPTTGDYVLFGQTIIDYDGDTASFNGVSGRASIDETGASPVLTQLDVEICWSGTFDATSVCGCAGSTVDLDSYQVLRPALPESGTGNSVTSISWGTLTGWTSTGRLFCETTPGGGCSAGCGCVPFFGFEGTGPPMPLSSPSFDTDPWNFIPLGDPGVLFTTPEFEIANLFFGSLTQDLRLVGVRAVAVKLPLDTYCVLGISTGTDWSWRLTDSISNSWSADVTNTATTSDELASLFATSISSVTPLASSSPPSLAPIAQCFDISGANSPFTLEVGLASQTPTCTVAGFAGCTFNPVIVPLPSVFAAVPSAPGWAILAGGLAFVALGFRLRRARAGKAATASRSRD